MKEIVPDRLWHDFFFLFLLNFPIFMIETANEANIYADSYS